MQSRQVSKPGERRVWVAVLNSGEEAKGAILELAEAQDIRAASIVALGAFSRAVVGYFDWQKKEYQPIPIESQVEVITLVGDIAENDKGKPDLHAHTVLGAGRHHARWSSARRPCTPHPGDHHQRNTGASEAAHACGYQCRADRYKLSLPRNRDPRQDARAAGLHHVSDETMPGITRHGAGGRFFYRMPAGGRVRDAATLARIRALAIPPAWTDVWIAPRADAHLAATGRDQKGRKQYRYHADFAAVRDAAKYEHLARFAESLPALRRRLKADLRRSGLPREKILAAIVSLLEHTLIRVGNEDYARTNGSFGLTTLRNRHVKVKGEQLTFLFKGKSGKIWNLSLRDRRVAKVIRSCQELPGQHLFEYRDISGAVHAVSSTDVNAYLRGISGRDISAKDFRTWAGTVQAAIAFAELSGAPGKRAVRAAIAQVAERLGNTVAVCRKCYIHPAIVSGGEAGILRLRMTGSRRAGLSGAERFVLRYLRKSARSMVH